MFDTPISESAILGGAIGSAMFGRRPIVEIMWADFSWSRWTSWSTRPPTSDTCPRAN
ncbi:hypothetical protein P9209_14530 [Prescottella defluvii]|nr:hypothetical protein P9209_14530 [Prescottella defluvii]